MDAFESFAPTLIRKKIFRSIQQKLLLGRSLVVGVGDSVNCSTGVIRLASSGSTPTPAGTTWLVEDFRLVADDTIPDSRADRSRIEVVSYSLSRFANRFKLICTQMRPFFKFFEEKHELKKFVCKTIVRSKLEIMTKVEFFQ